MAPKESLCWAQHPGSFLGRGGPGASLLPLECNKGSHCVPCLPSSGVVVGIWSQAPVLRRVLRGRPAAPAPGTEMNPGFSSWMDIQSQPLWPQLHGLCCLSSWANGELGTQVFGIVPPFGRGTQRKEPGREEQGWRIWGLPPLLQGRPWGQAVSASQLLTGPWLLPKLQRLLRPQQPHAASRAFLA